MTLITRDLCATHVSAVSRTVGGGLAVDGPCGTMDRTCRASVRAEPGAPFKDADGEELEEVGICTIGARTRGVQLQASRTRIALDEDRTIGDERAHPSSCEQSIAHA